MKDVIVVTFSGSILGISTSAGAIYRRLKQASGGYTGTGGPADRSFTPPELAQYDGKNGNGT
jgi:hypothetical protein